MNPTATTRHTFAQYLEKWLKQSTAQGLNNPLVKMPVKRFRSLQEDELSRIASGGVLVIGTMSDPIARNLYKNFQTRIRERGEHSAFVCSGAVEMTIAGGIGQQSRTALFPVGLKRASLSASSEQVRVTVSDEEAWQFNPVLQAHLKGFGIGVPSGLSEDPAQATNWVRSQLGNRASHVGPDAYVGLFSSQQMVTQARLGEPSLRQVLARNPVVRAKVDGNKVPAVALGEITDEGLEELGLVLPCDDSQLRVVQLSDGGCCLQVEGPPGTGKSQTIANIISNALYHGRNALLVCDKKAAIVQVEERLSGCGLKPALLNLHDEDLDKREFLKQANDRLPPDRSAPSYPFAELRETRATLNARVKFGRATAHPSLGVAKREALAGLIQLRKELQQIPKLEIANWQALSKARLTKLLGHLSEWPDLAAVLTNGANVWNGVRVESFDDNPNAANEVQALAQRIVTQVDSLDEVRERAAVVGIENPLAGDSDVAAALALAESVLNKPSCHPKLVGNSAISLSELGHLKQQWERKEALVSERHPVPLNEKYSAEVEREAKELLGREKVSNWQDLSQRAAAHAEKLGQIDHAEARYSRLCDQLGIVHSPTLKIRRAQLQTVLGLGSVGASIPRPWWGSDATPVLSVASWKAQLQACATKVKDAPLPLHFLALERVASSHWRHVEAKAEHGFNVVSYCLHFIDDRKCKYALRQVFPSIPARRFKKWQDVTLHAVSAFPTLAALRSASESHVVLTRLASAYLAVAHDGADKSGEYLAHDDVHKVEKAAALVEQTRARNDLFEIRSPHWQAAWDFPNPELLAQVETLQAELDELPLPAEHSDNVQDARLFYEQARQSIETFLSAYEREVGDRRQEVMAGFAAQKEHARCERELMALAKYLDVQGAARPDWHWLQQVITWRDSFERQRGSQRLDIDSGLWRKLRDQLTAYVKAMDEARQEIEEFFEGCADSFSDYQALTVLVGTIVEELPQYPLWLEKKRWQDKIVAFPEIAGLWSKVSDGSVRPEHARRLFCFNFLRMCDPIAKPNGLEFKQTLKTFGEQDDRLASWIIEHLKTKLREAMRAAATNAAQSESELRRLAGLQRIRGTVRELVNSHLDYLLAAKPCWMMSPTSLANLVDSRIFDEHGIPFDLVIFDEALQIRVLDGLLSMAFGKQVLIVGDRNQLPPTDFFAGFADGDDDAQGHDFGLSESLLDEFGGVFDERETQVMLLSHYRSETPDLIRFSNDWFYAGKLEMYPPAHISGLGRRLHYVPNAVYSETAGQRNNPTEAREVVKLIELHVQECPERSLGVVTMNIPQMELIDEQLQFMTSERVRTFCANDARFFLRNLETVQGDEMDRIILSLTYGKNPEGHFSAAVLGPITKSGGERRLNVAITRSRNGLTVVSSLKAADLEASGAQSRGFKCLKALLLDLENTEQARTFGIGNRRFERTRDGVSQVVFCDSPFEEQVVEFLENEGYEIECQYGAGNFWLDSLRTQSCFG